MQIKFDEEQMRQLVSKTIYESLTTEGKDDLIQQAIKSLLVVESRNSYGGVSKVNILEKLLKESAEMVARKMIQEHLEGSSEFKSQIECLLKDAVAKMFATEMRDKLIGKICESVISGLTPRDY